MYTYVISSHCTLTTHSFVNYSSIMLWGEKDYHFSVKICIPIFLVKVREITYLSQPCGRKIQKLRNYSWHLPLPYTPHPPSLNLCNLPHLSFTSSQPHICLVQATTLFCLDNCNAPLPKTGFPAPMLVPVFSPPCSPSDHIWPCHILTVIMW